MLFLNLWRVLTPKSNYDDKSIRGTENSLFMLPNQHNLQIAMLKMRITLCKPNARWTDGGQKAGYKTQKKTTTPKDCELLNV
jgi:hypothetical protein